MIAYRKVTRALTCDPRALTCEKSSQTIAIRLHTKASTVQRTVDQTAPTTPLRGMYVCIFVHILHAAVFCILAILLTHMHTGLNIELPVLFPLLYQLPIFNFFQHDAVSKCVTGCAVLHFQEQEDIVAQGDKVGALFILVFGKLLLSETLEGGHECALQHLEPGQVVGEVSLLTHDPFPVTVTAIEPSVVVKVPIATISPVLKSQPNQAVDCMLYHEAIEYYKTDEQRKVRNTKCSKRGLTSQCTETNGASPDF